MGIPVLALLIATPAAGNVPAASTGPTIPRINQVSNHHGVAKRTDRKLVNAWGLTSSPTSPLWVANNGTDTATIYSGGVGGAR